MTQFPISITLNYFIFEPFKMDFVLRFSQETFEFEMKPGKCCPEKAKNELNWVATSSIDDMCVDLWRFQQANPLGYADDNE